jgi:hypothetical protein
MVTIGGHKTLKMVVGYSHQNGEHIREAMEKLEMPELQNGAFIQHGFQADAAKTA